MQYLMTVASKEWTIIPLTVSCDLKNGKRMEENKNEIFFPSHSVEMAEKITEEGRKALHEMIEKFGGKEKFDKWFEDLIKI